MKNDKRIRIDSELHEKIKKHIMTKEGFQTSTMVGFVNMAVYEKLKKIEESEKNKKDDICGTI